MSSPPHATSPPYPSQLSISRKRPSINTAGPASSKRRKPSTVSALSSNHPLRQTSFPPPESALASRASSFSPNVEESVTGRSSTPVTGRKRRGGKKAGLDGRSTAAGSATGARTGQGSLVNGAGVQGAEEAEDDEDEDDGGAGDTVLEGGAAADEAQLQLERENLRILIEAFNTDQSDRYDMWRRVRLKRETVRRLVNQTLSQSVPISVVTTVSGYTKLFIGEIIERARDVQAEWLASSPLLPNGERNPRIRRVGAQPNGSSAQIKPEPNASPTDGDTQEATQSSLSSAQTCQKVYDVKEMDKGPLTPDHLREALRRYKRDREGGSTGYQGLSLYGRSNTASRVGGKRLFK